MVQVISFPGLGIDELALDRVAFYLGGFPIYWYGVIIAAGFLLAITYILYRCSAFGLDSDRAMDALLGICIGGIIGARLYYVMFSGQSYTLMEILQVRDGGLAIYGGVIGGFLAGFFMCRWRKVRFIPMADATVGGVILGQAIGRWGNFVNVEAFGSNTTLPWGMAGEPIAQYLAAHQGSLAAQGVVVDPTMPVHPTFFYESMWCFLGFVVLCLFVKHRHFDGEVTLLYLAWYGAGRIVIEGLRTDSLMWGGLRVSQALAVLLVVFSLGMILFLRSRKEPKGLYVNTQEGQENVARNRKSKQQAPSAAQPDVPAPQTEQIPEIEAERALDEKQDHNGEETI